MDKDKLLKKIYRLKKSQAEAEALLEKKSFELYQANKKLLSSNLLLEEKMSVISKEVKSLAKFPKENPNPVIRITKDAHVLFANANGKKVINFLKNKENYLDKLIEEIMNLPSPNEPIKKIIQIHDYIFELTSIMVLEEGYINIYGRDISEQKKAEEGMIRAIKDAEQANKAKSQFLANMSHEIRTPLNGMLGYIGLLEKSNLNQVQVEQLSIVAQSGHLLLSLINDILDFSKIEADKLVLEKTKTHAKRCLENIIEVMAGQVFDKGLEFPVYIDERIPKYALLDEARLRQVLVNLIGNAIKYTPSGEVSLRMELSEDDGNQLYFEVKDTGVGIPEKNLKSIFRAFEQADISDTRKYGGTGLGLTISQRIVEAMGGDLKAVSVEGKGSTFYFSVPLQPLKGESDKVEYTNRNFQNKEAVLLFMSCHTIQNNLIERLSSWNIVAKKAKNKKDLDWNFENISQCTIIIDPINLKLFGIQDKLVQLSEKGVHIIVVSSPKEKYDLLDVIQFKKFNFISKPIQREDLFNSISSKSHYSHEEKITENVVSLKKKNLKLSASKILLVEDNLINQQVALAMLEVHGLSADIANNGQECLDMHAAKSYDLILMDCQMPVMDGFDATTNIRKSDENVIIIAMTANAFKKVKQQCFDVGMNDFITKPITDELLAESIKKNLMKRIA